MKVLKPKCCQEATNTFLSVAKVLLKNVEQSPRKYQRKPSFLPPKPLKIVKNGNKMPK